MVQFEFLQPSTLPLYICDGVSLRWQDHSPPLIANDGSITWSGARECNRVPVLLYYLIWGNDMWCLQART